MISKLDKPKTVLGPCQGCGVAEREPHKPECKFNVRAVIYQSPDCTCHTTNGNVGCPEHNVEECVTCGNEVNLSDNDHFLCARCLEVVCGPCAGQGAEVVCGGCQ